MNKEKTGKMPLAAKEPPESLIVQTKGMLRRFDLKAKKGLGQHFLVDSGVLKRILAASELTGSDIVIEVGPGLGVLTRELAKAAGWVIAVELDGKLAQILREELSTFGNVTVVQGDVLELDPEALLHEAASYPEGVDSSRYRVVANLPYYITSAVLRHFLTARKKPELMVVMVQKEVARQITAPPGEMSLLSVSVRVYGEPEIVSYVSAESFYPAPEVDSAILRVRIHPNPAIPREEEEGFFKLVRAGFSAARKQLVNSLSHSLKIPKDEVSANLKEAGIAPSRRAETLTVREWTHLWEIFQKERQDAGTSGTSQDKSHP